MVYRFWMESLKSEVVLLSELGPPTLEVHTELFEYPVLSDRFCIPVKIKTTNMSQIIILWKKY